MKYRYCYLLPFLISIPNQNVVAQTPTASKKAAEKSSLVRVPSKGILNLSVEQFTGKIAITTSTVIHITGRFDSAKGVKELSLRVYGVKHAATREDGNFDLILDASKLGKGENLVKVQIDQGNGVGQVAAQASFFAYSKPPVQLIVPTENKNFAKPILLTLAGEAGFKPQSATFYKGGVRLPNKSSAFSAEWDATKETEKDYLLWAEVVSETGEKYQVAPIKVTVPPRVLVLAPSEAVSVSPKSETAEIRLRVIEGIKPKRVEYFVDGESVGVASKNPDDVFKLDISQRTSGDYRLTAQVEDEAGNKYTSPEAKLSVKNTVVDKQREEDDKILKAQTEEEERFRKEWDKDRLLALRRRVAGRVPARFRRGAGTVGRVNGLSVLAIQTVINGSVIDEREIAGEPLTVECFIRAGAGRVSLLASAKQDTQTSVKVAASVMKELVKKRGFMSDWSMLDVIIGYSDLTKVVGGDSVGIANTTAMMSAALNLPADDSVAMTGAIDSGGKVTPVSGIFFKGKTAFTDPKIKTLILPDNFSNAKELDALYKSRPILFATKRIILARTIDEVLRQTLIGYDEDKLKYAESKFISAMNSFLKGEDAVALNDLKAALKVTPENYTMQIWINIIQEAKQQSEKP